MKFPGHGVEGFSQFANFGPAPKLNSLGKVSPCESPAGLSKNLQRVSNSAGCKDTHSDTQQDCQQRQQARCTLHFVDTPVRFALRFLYHDRPIEGRDRAVRTEHLDIVLTFFDRKFLGGGELRFDSFVHKRAHDFQTLHVLPRHVLWSPGGHETALRIYYVGDQSPTADLMQAAYQELEIHNRADHSKEPSAVAYRTADQNHRP